MAPSGEHVPPARAAAATLLPVDPCDEREASGMFTEIVFIALTQVILGLLLCFAGFRLFATLLPMFGFFAGFLITAQAIQQLFGGGFLATVGSWVFGFVIGAFCALAAHTFYYAAVVILSASVGYEVGVGLMAGFGVTAGVIQFLVGVALAVAIIAVAIRFNLPKILIVALTAEMGASMMLTGILLATGHISLAALHWGVVGAFIRASWFWFLALIVITAAGILAQLRFSAWYTLAPYDAAPSLRQPVERASPVAPAQGPTQGPEPAV